MKHKPEESKNYRQDPDLDLDLDPYRSKRSLNNLVNYKSIFKKISQHFSQLVQKSNEGRHQVQAIKIVKIIVTVFRFTRKKKLCNSLCPLMCNFPPMCNFPNLRNLKCFLLHKKHYI